MPLRSRRSLAVFDSVAGGGTGRGCPLTPGGGRICRGICRGFGTLGHSSDVSAMSRSSPPRLLPSGPGPTRGAPRPQQRLARPSATQLGGSLRPACRPGSAAPAPRSAGVFPLPGCPQSRPASLRAKAPRRKPEPRGADSFLKRLAPALAFLKSSGDAIPASLPPRVVFTPRAARPSSPPAGGARRSGVQPGASRALGTLGAARRGAAAPGPSSTRPLASNFLPVVAAQQTEESSSFGI